MTNSTPTPDNSDHANDTTAQTEVLPNNLTQTAVLPDPAPQTQTQTTVAATSVPTGYPPVRPTNVLGIITLVLGVLGFAVVPVVTGHIALAQIKRTGDDGRGITVAGLVLGYIGLAGYVLAALFFFGLFFVTALAAASSY